MTTAAAVREQALLDRLGQGDPDALDVVVQCHAARLYRLAHGITRSAGDAEAIVREVCAALLERRDRLQPEVSLRTWLDRAATRAALGRRLSHAAADGAAVDPWLPTFLPDGHREGPRAVVAADWSTLPDHALLEGGALGTVRDTLDRLSPLDRAILVLADLEGLPVDEIGDAVGIDTATVRARLHRLRMALRERITHALVPSAAGG